MSTPILDQYVHIYRALERRALEHGQFVGWLKLDRTLCEQLSALCAESLTSGVYDARLDEIDGEELDPLALDAVNDRHFSQNVWLKVELESKNVRHDCSIYSDWSALLSYPDNLSNPIQKVFFVGDGTGNGQLLDLDSDDDKFNHYQGVYKVYQLIKNLAEQTDGGDSTIFYERALTFKFKLTEADLEHPVDIEAIDKLLEKDLHREAISCLICGELVKFLKDIKPERRFGHLIQHLGLLVSNVLLSYQGYIENYTFDKVRKEYLEKKTEYITKINKAFDDIALKLLSLPAGIWFATSQIEPSVVGELTFAKNVAVAVTVSLVFLILLMNLCGQFSVLRQLNKEYNGVFDRLEASFEKEGVNLRDVRKELESEETKVRYKLGASIALSSILVLLTYWLIWYTYNTGA